MKELEIAINQLRRAMKNTDKAEEKMWVNKERVNSDWADKISIEIAALIDEITVLNRYYNK